MYFDLEIELFFLSQTISILSHLEIQKKKNNYFMNIIFLLLIKKIFHINIINVFRESIKIESLSNQGDF